MKSFTYLLYIIFWESLVWGSWLYLFVNVDVSGWTFLVAIMLSVMAYPPGKWAELL